MERKRWKKHTNKKITVNDANGYKGNKKDVRTETVRGGEEPHDGETSGRVSLR